MDESLLLNLHNKMVTNIKDIDDKLTERIKNELEEINKIT
jgi:cysteinyl-tRNA synthetase